MLLVFMSQSVFAGYTGPKLNQDEINVFLDELESNPGWLPNNIEKLGQLRIDQFKEAIEYLDFTHFTFLHPVRIKGEEIPGVLGTEVERMSVWAVRGGELKPIPHQVDEYDVKLGWIYVPGVSPAEVDGEYRVLDESDELIFMYRDTGKETYDPTTMKPINGKVFKELKFEPKIGPTRYAYIVIDSPDRSTADYASIDLAEEETTIKTMFYTIKSDPESFINFRDFNAHVGPQQGTTIVDNLRITASAGILTKWARGTLDNDNIRIHIVGVHDGAVRVAALAKLEILFAGVQIFSLYTQVNFYDQGIHIPNRTELGSASYFARVLKNPSIEVSLDFVDVIGGEMSTASMWAENESVGVVDGIMTDVEIAANEIPLPGDWVWLDSKQGWNLFMKLSVPPAMTEGMSTSVVYEDDPNSLRDYENYPGANPRFGIRTNGLPDAIEKFHEMELDIGIWFPDTVGDDGPAVFNEELSSPPALSVKSLSPNGGSIAAN
ncbi:MAG: hypothetical protein COB04_06735 [Gammaproteobacteria bacterium]|nr:MAG: hypothetical protein COB04_06735 [Gammaproteobacteria bacterium]